MVEFCALFEPHYAKAGNGRPPIALERLLRMYFVATWFSLSDEACEDARNFLNLYPADRLTAEAAPKDASSPRVKMDSPDRRGGNIGGNCAAFHAL